MDRKNIAKLIPFPTVPRGDRLVERCKIVAKNFQDPDIGNNLMLYMTRQMYEVFMCHPEKEWLEEQVLAKLFELENLLVMYEDDDEPETDD